MKKSLLNISGKLPPDVVTLYQNVATVANDLAIPFFVVGASARDLVLYYGYDSKMERATQDIDFAIEVPTWSAFQKLKKQLLERDFSQSKFEHRVFSDTDIPVDIIPFGEIEENGKIKWPPEGDWEMSVLGFKEARENAQIIRLTDNPALDIPVATPEGMMLLKLISWLERAPEKRKKDATDLRYIIETYENIKPVEDLLYEEKTLLEKYAWDITLAAAHQLGIDSSRIASPQIISYLADFFDNGYKRLTIDNLINEMNPRTERGGVLLLAFWNGFNS